MLIGILEFQVDVNVGVDAEDNRAGLADVLELRPVILWDSGDNVDANDDFGDPAGRLRAHVFLREHFCAFEVHFILLSADAGGRDHARGKRGNNEVGGRKTFAAPVVVGRRVGDEFNLARSVCGRAAQFANVKCLLGNHVFYGVGGSMAFEAALERIFFKNAPPYAPRNDGMKASSDSTASEMS